MSEDGIQRVYKYVFEDFEQSFSMPRNAQFLCGDIQNALTCIWMLVDPQAPLENRRFYIYGTGDPILIENPIYRATYFEGNFVWHIFELGKEEGNG
jgi:hypothetical protein